VKAGGCVAVAVIKWQSEMETHSLTHILFAGGEPSPLCVEL